MLNEACRSNVWKRYLTGNPKDFGTAVPVEVIPFKESPLYHDPPSIFFGGGRGVHCPLTICNVDPSPIL